MNDKLYINGRPLREDSSKQGYSEGELKIPSWNVNDLTTDMKQSEEFLSDIIQGDITFLHETWTNKGSDIDLTGFIGYNYFRKFQNKISKRNSGGSISYIKEQIKYGVEIVRMHHDTIICIKLDKTFFSLKQDIYVGGVYVWGEDSPVYNMFNVDLFDIVQNDIMNFENSGSIFLVGDWSSRTGDKNDYIEHDKGNLELDDLDYMPDSQIPRDTIDRLCNRHGNKLLDLCKSTEVKICHGRVSDTNKYTYANRNGASVIDL